MQSLIKSLPAGLRLWIFYSVAQLRICISCIQVLNTQGNPACVTGSIIVRDFETRLFAIYQKDAPNKNQKAVVG